MRKIGRFSKTAGRFGAQKARKYYTAGPNSGVFFMEKGARATTSRLTRALARYGGTASTAKRLGLGLGIAGLGAAALGATAAYKLSNFREGLVRGLFPGSAMPMEAGTFGTRTTAQPAGIGGLRFNFRRG